MDLDLSEEQNLLIGTVRRFVREEILPLEQSLDPDADELEPDDHERLTQLTCEMGLYGLDVPPEFGGPDVDLVTRTLLAMEMSQHRAGLYAPCYGVFWRCGARSAVRSDGGSEGSVPLPPAARGEEGFLRPH
jgi:alkylation response protein AidB-like acyl-CoA dehydrogenase